MFTKINVLFAVVEGRRLQVNAFTHSFVDTQLFHYYYALKVFICGQFMSIYPIRNVCLLKKNLIYRKTHNHTKTFPIECRG